MNIRMTDGEFAEAQRREAARRDGGHSADATQRARAYWNAAQEQKQRDREALQEIENADSKQKYFAEMQEKWIANGGDKTSFQAEWSKIWTEELRRRVDGDDAKQSTRQYLNNRISYGL